MMKRDHSNRIRTEDGEPGSSRRQFLERCVTLLGGITVVGILAPLAEACDTTLEPRNDTGSSGTTGGNNGSTATFDVSGLKADGEGILTRTKGPDRYAIMIVRIAGGEYKALSTRCTHQGCDVNTPKDGSIQCPCHGSRFSPDGSVINGPASEPLASYPLTYNATNNTVTVTLS